MGRKSIPSSRQANSRTTTPFSRRSKRRCDCWSPVSGAFRTLRRIQGETTNIEHRTSNIQRDGMLRWRCQFSAIGSWALDVRCSMFCSCAPRRVMGAWWPSRSSKPLSARSTGRGMFDSYPLRHFHLRFTICELRFEEATWAASLADPLVNRKSQFVNPGKGGGSPCRANKSLG